MRGSTLIAVPLYDLFSLFRYQRKVVSPSALCYLPYSQGQTLCKPTAALLVFTPLL